MATSEAHDGGRSQRSSSGRIRRIKVTAAEKMAAQYLVERAEKAGEPVRPAYRAIADAK